MLAYYIKKRKIPEITEMESFILKASKKGTKKFTDKEEVKESKNEKRTH